MSKPYKMRSRTIKTGNAPNEVHAQVLIGPTGKLGIAVRQHTPAGWSTYYAWFTKAKAQLFIDEVEEAMVKKEPEKFSRAWKVEVIE